MFCIEFGRELVGRLGRCVAESSKSRAFTRLPENARIVTALAVATDEELRWKCQKLLAERSSTAPPRALAAPSAPALAMSRSCHLLGDAEATRAGGVNYL
jgi:hypothetical protein